MNVPHLLVIHWKDNSVLSNRQKWCCRHKMRGDNICCSSWETKHALIQTSNTMQTVILIAAWMPLYGSIHHMYNIIQHDLHMLTWNHFTISPQTLNEQLHHTSINLQHTSVKICLDMHNRMGFFYHMLSLCILVCIHNSHHGIVNMQLLEQVLLYCDNNNVIICPYNHWALI